MTRYYCTYFDRQYLLKGLALIDSLQRHSGDDFTLFVVCADELTRLLLTKLAIPHVITIPLHQLERGDSALLATKQARSLVEYYWTLTPTVILRILEQHPDIDILTYLDADLYFFSSPAPIFEELGPRSILIHGHRFSPAQAHLGADNGKYNVGLLSFRRDVLGMDALRWWRERCLEWCYARAEAGKMGDQMYLNDWPTRFKGVVELRHQGGGVGPWNHDQYLCKADSHGHVFVGDLPIIFYHFHSCIFVTPHVVLPVKHPHYPLPLSALQYCFIPYVRAMEKAATAVLAIVPDFSYGLHTSEPVTAAHTFFAKHAHADQFDAMKLSQTRMPLDEDWDLYCSAQVIHDRKSLQPRQGSDSSSEPVARKTGPHTIAPLSPLQGLLEIAQDLAVLARQLPGVGNDSTKLGNIVADWQNDLLARRPDSPVCQLIGTLHPVCVAMLPSRLKLALGYFEPQLQHILDWLVASKETTNLTYDLTVLNKAHLQWFIALVTGTPGATIARYFHELEQDEQLKAHVRQLTLASQQRFTADEIARYGRRLGWYAIVRAMKPKVIVETGVDKGLGTCVLAAAVMKNQAEGFPGHVYATEIDPKGGFLLQPPYTQFGTILYGDSIQTLQKFPHPIDLAVCDSAHTAEYERGEYEAIRDKLPNGSLIISDNAHVTHELANFATASGKQFLFFQEKPGSHFYPGAGIGIAFDGLKTPNVTPTSNAAQHSNLATTAERTQFPGHQEGQRQVRRQGNGQDSDPSASWNPLVSVIVSSYNAEAFMAECLEDLERQTLVGQMEIIIVDAASPQNERVVIDAFQQRCRNILYVRTPERIGVYAAWNMALKLATGTYVTPFSTNDRLRQDAYEILARTLDLHPDVALVYGDTYLTRYPHQTFEQHQREGIWQWPEYNYSDLRRRCLIGPHPMWRRSVHQDVGYFDESFVALGDQDFWLRLGASRQLLHIPEVIGLYWRSSEGLSNKPEIANPEEARLRARYGHATTPTPAPAVAHFDCSIIIPVWNKRELTEQCLSELARVTTGISYEVIVVDNHSTDDTAQFLNQLSGDIQIIRNSENLGFAKACNQGAQAARGRFLIFLNNDTIPLSNWLPALVAEVTSHPEVGIVGSKLLYEDDTIQHAGVVFSREGLMPYHLYRHFHRDHPAVNQRRTFQSVTAACLLIRREIFETAGGFDEGFQNGLEDVDLCLKVSDKGWQIVYQPLSMLYHLESQTPGRKTYEQANALRFLKRWGQRWWVADEDIYYYEDGYASVHTKDEDQEQLELRSLQHDEEKASWKLVVDTERAALRQDITLVESLLARWDEWPSVADVLVWGAWLCIRTGHSPLSRHFYQKLLRHHDDPTARKALARMALEDGNLPEADSHLGTLLKQFPRDGEGWVLRGILGMQQTQFAEAEQAFLTALAHQGDRRKCMMGLGMARTGLDESDQAWNDFCTVLNEYPDDAEAIHWLLRAGSVRGSWTELSKRLQGFVSRNPANLSVRYALAGVLIRSGRIDAAQQEYQTLCTLDPSYEGLTELAQALSTEDTLAEIVPQS
jgi:GT2 family glycosyltransferase/Flp pilus assembly protein TadD/predicted O-methyltransferase YrrM